MTKKRSFIIIAVVIAIIILSIIISIYLPNRKKIEEERNESSIEYFTVEKNGKVGIKNNEDEEIIEPQYEKIIIINPHKAVFMCKSSDNIKFVNEKNEEIFTEYENVEPIEIFMKNEYEQKLLKYQKDGKYGLLEIDGKKLTDAKYDEISSLGYKQGDILVKENDKYGILDENGNIKIKIKYDEIKSDEYYTDSEEYKKSGYVVCTTTSQGYRYGYYDYEGSEVLSTEYNQITRVTQVNSDDIYLIVAKNGQYGVYVNNSKIINNQYQYIDYNENMGLFIVERTGQYGVINAKGVEILKTEYSDIKINGIYLYTTKGEEQKVFDTSGKEVDIPFNTIIYDTGSSKYYIKYENENYFILDSNFETITKNTYRHLEYAYDKYFIASNEQDKMGIIDIEENVIIKFEYELIQGIKNKNLILAMDFTNSKTDIYDNKFDLALEMSNANIENLDDGIRVYNGKTEVFIDNNGKIVNK